MKPSTPQKTQAASSQPIDTFNQYVINGQTPAFVHQQQKTGYASSAASSALSVITGKKYDLHQELRKFYAKLHNKLSDAALDKATSRGIPGTQDLKTKRTNIKNEYEELHKLLEALCTGLQHIDKTHLKQVCDALTQAAQKIESRDIDIETIKNAINSASNAARPIAAELELKQKLSELQTTLDTYGKSLLDIKTPKTFVQSVVSEPCYNIARLARSVFNTTFKNPFRGKEEFAQSNDKQIEEQNKIAALFKQLEEQWHILHEKSQERAKLPNAPQAETTHQTEMARLAQEMNEAAQKLHKNLHEIQDHLRKQEIQDMPLKRQAIKLLASTCTILLRIVAEFVEYMRSGTINDEAFNEINYNIAQAVKASARTSEESTIDPKTLTGHKAVDDLKQWKEGVAQARQSAAGQPPARS